MYSEPCKPLTRFTKSSILDTSQSYEFVSGGYTPFLTATITKGCYTSTHDSALTPNNGERKKEKMKCKSIPTFYGLRTIIEKLG